jgi:hypothetical protein
MLALADTSKLVTAHPAAVTNARLPYGNFFSNRSLEAIRIEGHPTGRMVSDNPLFSPFHGENSTTMAFHASQNDKATDQRVTPDPAA